MRYNEKSIKFCHVFHFFRSFDERRTYDHLKCVIYFSFYIIYYSERVRRTVLLNLVLSADHCHCALIIEIPRKTFHRYVDTGNHMHEHALVPYSNALPRECIGKRALRSRLEDPGKRIVPPPVIHIEIFIP